MEIESIIYLCLGIVVCLVEIIIFISIAFDIFGGKPSERNFLTSKYSLFVHQTETDFDTDGVGLYDRESGEEGESLHD